MKSQDNHLWQRFWQQEADALFISQGAPQPAARVEAIFPGSFNPLHEGHRRMAGVAERWLQSPVTFEISIDNVDKPSITADEARARASQFDEHDLLLTRAPTFVDKAKLFPQSTFVVGADTIVRIGHPRFYGGDEAAAKRAIANLSQSGCRFLVFGRLLDGAFQTLRELTLSEELAAICDEVTGAEFRQDLSSTQLRQLDRRRRKG